MSLIKLQGNASGTGAFTIAAPNGNTDRTLTLPDATGTVVTADGSGTATFNRLSTDGTILDLKKDGTTVGSIGTLAGRLTVGTDDTGLIFQSAFDNIQPVTITGNTGRDATISLGASDNRFKDLYLSGGVYLGGTGSANLLDDYEEGTWTPTFVLGATGASYTNQYGRYIKIGDVVHCWFLLVGSWTATGDDMRVGALPFTRAFSSTWTAAGWITGNAFSGAQGLTLVPSGNNYVYAAKADNSGSVKLNTGSSIYMEGSFSYSTYN